MKLSLSNLITKASRVVIRDYQRECAPYNISPSQAGIVYTIYKTGSSSQVELAERLHLEKTNINAMVRKLSTAGLVEVQKVKEDGRKSRIVLTSLGQKLAENLILVDKKVAEKYLDMADSPEEAQIIIKFLEKIVFE